METFIAVLMMFLIWAFYRPIQLGRRYLFEKVSEIENLSREFFNFKEFNGHLYVRPQVQNLLKESRSEDVSYRRLCEIEHELSILKQAYLEQKTLL